MALSDIKIRNAKALEKPYKLADGGGLYVLVKPDGGKYWRLKYRYAGKEKLLAIGVYPDVGPAAARAARDQAKQILRDGKDPVAEKKEKRGLLKLLGERTFEAIAREWLKPQHRPQGKVWTPDHAARVRESLEDDVFPYLGAKAISDITAPQLLAVLKKVQARGALETAQRILQRCRSIFGFAMAYGLHDRNPTTEAELEKHLAAPERKNRAALKAADLPEFLRKLEAYDGLPLTKLALKLQVLTWVRPGELRAAEWVEVDVDNARWDIPGPRMKMREPHVVPLSRQALQVLEELRPITGGGKFLFPNQQTAGGCMSENTLLYALYRMGYHTRATGHGFRATASTILNEMRRKRGNEWVRRWDADAIERQLAHKPRNKVRAAYDRSEHLEQRIELMQAWADYLDDMAGKVTPIRKDRMTGAA